MGFAKKLKTTVRTLWFLSCRRPELGPGRRHCDWRSVGRRHCHHRGDCFREEDGKILVSTSPQFQIVMSRWPDMSIYLTMERNIFGMSFECLRLPQSYYFSIILLSMKTYIYVCIYFSEYVFIVIAIIIIIIIRIVSVVLISFSVLTSFSFIVCICLLFIC